MRQVFERIAIGMAAAAVVGFVGLVGHGVTHQALAMGTEAPADPCAKHAKGSKAWKACRRKAGLPTANQPAVDDAATLGYALAKAGRHTEALAVLKPHEATDDVRVLTYIGFAERKLGRIDSAMSYYRRALAIEPRNVATLEYLGEAHLQKGDLAAARATLSMIAGICGMECEAWRQLSGAIEAGTSRSPVRKAG